MRFLYFWVFSGIFSDVIEIPVWTWRKKIKIRIIYKIYWITRRDELFNEKCEKFEIFNFESFLVKFRSYNFYNSTFVCILLFSCNFLKIQIFSAFFHYFTLFKNSYYMNWKFHFLKNFQIFESFFENSNFFNAVSFFFLKFWFFFQFFGVLITHL